MEKRSSSIGTSRRQRSLHAVSTRSIWCVSLLLSAAVAGGVSPEVTWEIQGSAHVADVTESTFNPGNRLAWLPERELRLALRPDVFATLGPVDLMLRPRVTVHHARTDAAATAAESTGIDAIVNEWRLRWRVTDALDVAAGREHMLWGPARALMPSNPFTPETGRNNPFRDVAGRDYLRLNLLVGDWTFSAMTNLDPGRDRPPALPPLASISVPVGFRRVHALKADHIGHAHQLSLLGARTEGGPWHLGGYFDWTAGVATRLYVDGRLLSRNPTPEPAPDVSLPVGWGFVSAERQRGGVALAGVSHTLPQGTTVTLEAIYNHGGYDRRTARDLHVLADRAAAALAGPDPRAAGEAAGLLALAARAGTPLLRRRYDFVQIEHRRSDGRLSASVRYLREADDGGGRLTLIGEWQPGDRMSAFAVAMRSHGAGTSEFGRYQRSMVMAGIRVFY
jgi:hypothetical protein